MNLLPQQPIIIAHTQKCGGTSVKTALEAAVGADQVLSDYAHGGINNPSSLYHRDRARYWREVPRGVAAPVVIGHFNIGKWSHIAHATRVTLLRHPVDRLLSHYFFWKRQAPNPNNPLWIDLVENDRDLVWLASQKLVRFIYTDGYFADVEMKQFDLILVFERLRLGVERLSALIQRDIALPHVNPTASKVDGYVEERSTLERDEALMARLHELLAADIALYEAAIRLPSAA